MIVCCCHGDESSSCCRDDREHSGVGRGAQEVSVKQSVIADPFQSRCEQMSTVTSEPRVNEMNAPESWQLEAALPLVGRTPSTLQSPVAATAVHELLCPPDQWHHLFWQVLPQLSPPSCTSPDTEQWASCPNWQVGHQAVHMLSVTHPSLRLRHLKNISNLN
mgnify:CR=1 FL=1